MGVTSSTGGKLSVRMFSSEYPPCWGGVGKHVQNLCRRIAPHINLSLVTASYAQPDEAFQVTNLARIRVRNFPLLVAQYLVGIRHQRQTKNTNVITHIHVPHAFLPKGQRKIVSTFHVVWHEYSKAMETRRPISLFDMQFPTLNRRLLITEKRLARISDSVIAVSQSVKRQLIEVYGVDEEKIYVIHNGVESSQYHPSLTRENLILYVGRQTAHKGLSFLLEGFAKFARDHGEYKLILVGERLEGGVDPSLLKLAERLGISSRVMFAGRLPDPQLRNILGRARCLVLPSLAESFGMAVLEAMASETPVIATNVGGIPELIGDGQNGLLVPPANPDAIANSLDRITTDPELWSNLVREGKRTAEEFSWDKMARATMQVYREVCS